MRRRLLVVLAVAAGLSVGIGIGYRAHQTQEQRQHIDQLCVVVRGLVAGSDKALDGIAYYRRHPAELAAAHARTRAALRLLDCSTIN